LEQVIVIIHIILAVAIIGLVLIQKGSGGGLGIGGGGAGGLATPRSAANILTKATTWAAILFFGTSLTLAILAGQSNQSSVLDELDAVDNATPGLIIENGELEIAPDVPTDSTEPSKPAEIPVTP